MRKLGELLDKEDAERAETTGKQFDEMFGVEVKKLQERFLGKTVANNLRKGQNVLLTGIEARNPSNVVPFLYFYPMISLQICPHCPQAHDPSLLMPFMEKGFASVFLIGPFSQAPKRFQELAFEYPESFVGPKSYSKYQYFSLNPVEPGRTTHENHYCYQCVEEKLSPHVHKINRLDDHMRDTMGRTLTGILKLQTPMAEKFAERFVMTLQRPTPQSVNRLRTSVILADHLAGAKSLGAVPQMDSDFCEKSQLFLRGLRIYNPRGIDLREYLNFLDKFRGFLSSEAVPQTMDDILGRVIQLNEEVSKIKTSKRFQMGLFVSEIVQDLFSLFTQVITKGVYSWEGAKGTAMSKLGSSRSVKIEAQILSKFFGVSKTGIHVWQVRRSLEKRKNQKGIR
ncbi:MAG: hypothetical protein NWE90_01125 [Candidatus Bathyarchaeota archaeon]|nr:hypothetical protein [Candidatus Bathyarchaeota archaeon]